MPTDDIQRFITGTAPAPAQWTVPGNGQIQPKVVSATFDGTSAVVPFFPALKILSDGGRLVGIFPCMTSVLAGGQAEVSWFPGVSAQPASSSAGSGPAVLFDQTLSATGANFDTGAGGIPGTHKDLLVVAYIRTTEAVTARESGQVVINNDTVGTYKSWRILGHSGGAAMQGDSPGGWFCMSSAGTAADAGNFSPNLLYIPNYTVAGGHFGLSLQGVIPTSANFTDANIDIGVHSYNASGVNPITRLQIAPNVGGGALFAAKSRCTIYGMG